MRVLQKAPPPVPPRSEKLALFPNLDEWSWFCFWERGFARNVRRRCNQVNTRWTYHWGYRDDEGEEDGESEKGGEGDEEESSEEEDHVHVD